MSHGKGKGSNPQRGLQNWIVFAGEEDYNLQMAVPDPMGHDELEDSSAEERQSHISGISQQDRDDKTIVLRQAASGEFSEH